MVFVTTITYRRITYDPAKRERTLALRGLDFEEAPLVFAGRTGEVVDERRNYGEKRIICYGRLRGRLVVVAYTVRDDCRHITSMRKANARAERRVASNFGI